MNGKKIIVSIVCVLIILAIISLAAVLILRVDAVQAQEKALETTGGGEIVAQEISSDGLLKEFSYTIINGDKWYKVEIGGFGQIEEIEQGTGDGWKY